MCQKLAFLAAFICATVTIIAGLNGLFGIELCIIRILKTVWIKKLIASLVLIVGIYAIIILFYPCPLPIH